MDKSFAGRDHAFIKYINITDISKNDFVLNTVTIDNVKQSKVIPHIDYLIDKEKIKSVLSEILSSTKKKLKRSSLIVEYNNKSHKSHKSHNSHKSYTHSKGSHKKHNTSKNADILLFKFDKKNNSNNVFKISNNKNIRSKTKKSNKPEIKEKLSEYLTEYEKHQINEKRKLEKQQAQVPIQSQFPSQFPAKVDFEAQKGAILGGPQTGISNPYQANIPLGINEDPVDTKCKAYGSDEMACKADSPPCYFTPYNKCIKSNRPPPNPNYQRPAPNLF